MKSMLVVAALALMAQAASVIDHSQEIEVHFGRENGRNTWQAGELHGSWSGMSAYHNLFGISEARRSRAAITVEGGSFGDQPLDIRCSGGESELSFAWITFDRQELVYACEFSRNGVVLDSRFELALQRRGLLGIGRNDRAGVFRHGDTMLYFETQRLSGVPFPSGRIPGYVIRHQGVDVGGMDYGIIRSRIYLPADESDPLREPVTIAAIVLALFMDPANETD